MLVLPHERSKTDCRFLWLEPKYSFSSIYDNYYKYEYLSHTFFITNYWFVLSLSLLPTCLSGVFLSVCLFLSLSLSALHPPFGPERRRPGCSRVVPGPTPAPRVLSKSYSTNHCSCSTPNWKYEIKTLSLCMHARISNVHHIMKNENKTPYHKYYVPILIKKKTNPKTQFSIMLT